MSKAKIEAMSVEEIREQLRLDSQYDAPSGAVFNVPVRRLILAWIHAEARARFYKHYEDFTFEQRLAEVKREVGWPED